MSDVFEEGSNVSGYETFETDVGIGLPPLTGNTLTFHYPGNSGIQIPYDERVMKDFYFVMQNGYFSMKQQYTPTALLTSVSLYCTTPLSNQDLVTIAGALGGNDYSVSEEDNLYLSDIISDLITLKSFIKSAKNITKGD